MLLWFHDLERHVMWSYVCCICSDSPSKLDSQVLTALSGIDIDQQRYPSITKWRNTVLSYSESQRNRYEITNHFVSLTCLSWLFWCRTIQFISTIIVLNLNKWTEVYVCLSLVCCLDGQVLQWGAHTPRIRRPHPVDLHTAGYWARPVSPTWRGSLHTSKLSPCFARSVYR